MLLFFFVIHIESLNSMQQWVDIQNNNVPERTTKSRILSPRDWKSSSKEVMFSWPIGTISASLAMETRPSFLPYETIQYGPPMSTVASLEAPVNMSAQETVLGHFFSTSSLISSINSNPFKVLLLLAVLSLPSWFNRMEASHPYT